MLDRLRGKLGAATLKLGAGASRLIPYPAVWTTIGFLFSVLSGYAYSLSTSWQSTAGLLLLISGFLDIVDGAVARSSGKVTKKGSFLDSTLDRVGEVAVFLGLILGGHAPPGLVLLAITLSLLVSYTRAKADSLGVSLAGVGIGERSERIMVLAVSSLLGLVYYGIIAVFVLAAITFVERIYRVSASLH